MNMGPGYGQPSQRSPLLVACLVLAGVVLALAVVAGIIFVSYYNKTITLQEEVKQAWSEVENQLKRRYDLIPNLVETVKGYAKHEKELFEHIADARKAYFAAKGVAAKAKAAGELERALSRLLLLQERYPQLRANENFLKLQDSLEGTENRIAVARTRYNRAVKKYNAFIKSFFGRFFASMVGAEPAEYFEIPEAEKEKASKAPKVKF